MPHHFNSAICLLIKDENEYINEWLKWHIGIGFEHFYIYDNGSKVPICESVAKNFLPFCTFIDYSNGYSCLQPDCYNHALSNYGEMTKWLAFIDTDEFIRTIDGQNINDFLRDYEQFDGLYVRWIMYNANGQRFKDSRPQRERFTQISTYDKWRPCGKSIIQPSKVKAMGTHFPTGILGQYRMVDGCKKPMRTGMEQFSKEDKIVIDHYFTRSLEEWLEKAQRGSCDPRVERKYDEFYLYNPDLK
ncbi:MAG: glycosyltransferase family 2 protein [Oscillospiraceae bacterium]|nr:glycosyltransferase family 2 protein [Oscillospiraceae bacterium]